LFFFLISAISEWSVLIIVKNTTSFGRGAVREPSSSILLLRILERDFHFLNTNNASVPKAFAVILALVEGYSAKHAL
jgi:hypothetical protein